MKVDVVMPVKNRVEPCLKECLDSLKHVPVNKLIVVDGYSKDGTLEIINEFCWENDVRLDLNLSKKPLGKCREIGIKQVETDWLLFLDSDNQVGEKFFQNAVGKINPDVGAVQGRRKETKFDPSSPVYFPDDSDWISYCDDRAMTHCTLIRTRCVEDIKIPEDMAVWEDEYIRQYIEDKNFQWVYGKDCFFESDHSDSHVKGFIDGKVHAKYGFKTGKDILDEFLSCKSPRNTRQLAGFIAGRVLG